MPLEKGRKKGRKRGDQGGGDGTDTVVRSEIDRSCGVGKSKRALESCEEVQFELEELTRT